MSRSAELSQELRTLHEETSTLEQDPDYQQVLTHRNQLAAKRRDGALHPSQVIELEDAQRQVDTWTAFFADRRSTLHQRTETVRGELRALAFDEWQKTSAKTRKEAAKLAHKLTEALTAMDEQRQELERRTGVQVFDVPMGTALREMRAVTIALDVEPTGSVDADRNTIGQRRVAAANA